MPKGCYIQLERKAKEYILDNIRSSYSVRTGLITRISTFEDDSGKNLTLENFTDYYHLDAHAIYKQDSFSRLCALAGAREDFQEDIEAIMRKAFIRICSIDSRRWLSFMLSVLEQPERMDYHSFSDVQKQMLQMFQFTVWQKSIEECSF
jgi:hypothetical protein